MEIIREEYAYYSHINITGYWARTYTDNFVELIRRKGNEIHYGFGCWFLPDYKDLVLTKIKLDVL